MRVTEASVALWLEPMEMLLLLAAVCARIWQGGGGSGRL